MIETITAVIFGIICFIVMIYIRSLWHHPKMKNEIAFQSMSSRMNLTMLKQFFDSGETHNHKQQFFNTLIIDKERYLYLMILKFQKSGKLAVWQNKNKLIKVYIEYLNAIKTGLKNGFTIEKKVQSNLRKLSSKMIKFDGGVFSSKREEISGLN